MFYRLLRKQDCRIAKVFCFNAFTKIHIPKPHIFSVKSFFLYSKISNQHTPRNHKWSHSCRFPRCPHQLRNTHYDDPTFSHNVVIRQFLSFSRNEEMHPPPYFSFHSHQSSHAAKVKLCIFRESIQL